MKVKLSGETLDTTEEHIEEIRLVDQVGSIDSLDDGKRRLIINPEAVAYFIVGPDEQPHGILGASTST